MQKVNSHTKANVVLGASYRPPNNDTDYQKRLCEEIESVIEQINTSPIWIGGDLNLPDIDWDTLSIKGNQNASTINRRFLDMDTLDIFLTN